MRTYGIGPADVLSAIRESRNAIAFWTAKNGDDYRVTVPAGKREAIVADHNAQIRDLRITLAAIRFDNDEMLRFVAPEFTPIIVTDAIPADSEQNAESVDADTMPETEMVDA